ncbi:uncharacterized protein LOC120074655 isoform X2 [Benincasa hispida]|uniref:uncharacterized protein LOC120074655 isoform X2 n=1 Tax=Benincasa hispida TaxID=102211 RepID=UPI0018FFA44E|nr:uncharacterized protein LOC120074655 isoform X2 [Benincasa hispida]
MIRHSHYNVDRSSIERLPLRAGNSKNEKQRNLPTMGSDSTSCSSGVTEEDSFTRELGWRSSKGSFGAPVKKLLADEMLKETEIKKRSPGVIAKLMGLDGMPSTRCAYNRQKCPSEGSSPRCISKEKVGRRGTYFDGQMTRRSSKDQQEFKDVFEVLETSKTGQSRNPDQRTPNFVVTESEMAFIRHKFLDAKRLSTDEKSQDSREFHDALDALESNRDLLLKFLHQPGSLFTRHLHDLQDAGSCSSRGCLPAIESLDNRKCDYPGFRGNPDWGTPPKNSSKSNHNQRGGHSSYSDSSFSAHSTKSSKILERNDELDHLPTRIVVLKPNIGKVQNARNIVYQSHSFQECSDLGELKTVERTNKEFRGKKDSLDKKVVSRRSYKESKEIPNGKTRQMRNEVSTPPMNITCSSFQGYAGDQSSCSLSGNESAEEPVVRTVNIKSSSNLNMGYRQSSSRHKESSISREAKKRLTARWRSSRNSEDKGVGRGSTLADMLAANAKEATLADSYAQITKGFPDKFSNDVQPDKEVEPLGISSNDGWKDECSKLTRSRSLPASSIGFGSPKIMHRSHKQHLISRERKQENNKAVKVNFDQRERLPCQKPTSSFRDSNDMLMQTPGNPISMNTCSLDNSSSKMASTEFEASCSYVDRSPISQSVEDDGDACTMTFPETPDHLELETSEYISRVGNSYVDHQDNVIQEEGASVESPAPLHKSVPALESPASSKEADQPSPVSVLEPAFGDDLSSCSECFESVSADLQGLRMQLQLLKFESEAFTERPMLVSSDEDATELASELPDEEGVLLRTNDSWEFSYLLDILNNAGLNDNAKAGALLATLHTSDCPIDPKMFEQLEEKHSLASSMTRSDRRLLFDRINSGILTIGQQFIDPQPWVRRPSKTKLARKWMMKNELQNKLCKFLDTQIVKNDVVEEESEWQDLGDEIDVIGKEIEMLMLNELLAEVVTM